MLSYGRLAAVAVLFFGGLTPVFAQSAENVAVVINDDSAASQTIGEHYVKQRHIPPANVVHINVAPDETIPRTVYQSAIEQPIAAAIARGNLQDRILYIVLTKGVPLRIDGGGGTEGTRASVDSELTLLYREMAGQPAATIGRVANPYFLGTADIKQAHHFSHREYDIYLVTRLDAFTVDEALTLIDAAIAPRTDGAFLLDERAALVNAQGDRWLDAAADRLRAVKPDAQVTLEKTVKAAAADAPLLGYASWGSTDPQLQRRSTGQRFVNGALAMTLAGADARTFQPPPPDWSPMKDPRNPVTWFAGSPQSLIGDLIRDGATGAAGSVAEPFVEGTPRPDIALPAYAAGFNLAEAFYLATPALSWQTVVIGDPLCGPFVSTTLPRGDLDPAIDRTTELPSLFGARRLALVKAELKDDQQVAPILLRAESRLDRGDTAGARALLLEATQQAPKLTGPQLQLAMLDEAAGDHDAANKLYRSILDLQPDNAVALNNLAYSLAVYAKDATTAKPLAARAVSVSKRNPTVVDTLAWVEHLLGDDVQAAALLEEAMKGAPTNADIRLHAAVVAAARGKTAEARLRLDEALKRNPALARSSEVLALQSAIGSSGK